MQLKESWTLDDLLRDYEHYQLRVRGLKLRTIRGYWFILRQFLLQVFGDTPIKITQLTALVVHEFIFSLQSRLSPRSIRLFATALRSLFRFLRVEGLCDARLEMAVPSVAARRLWSLPRGLSPEQHSRLIESLGTKSICGYRDRAIVLCLSSLAMRPGELAEVTLDDINWRDGTVLLRSRKTGRGAILPLPGQAGRAIVDYLTEERPQTSERRLFVWHSGRHRGQAITSSIVSGAVRRALRRAGINAPIRGAYVLRHTVAIGLVLRGTNLKEVADLLGHRDLDTTTIYAKVDTVTLRDVGLPWPEVRL